MKIYRLKGIKKYYDSVLALDVVDLTITGGTIVGIFGPNGSGKSTLLRILAFLEEPTEGELYFRGQKVKELTLGLRRRVTLLDQSPYLLKRSVFDNIAYGLKVRKDKENLKERVISVLRTVGLDPFEYINRKWYQLSGGEAQRVALASRLVLKPEVLLLDEPTSNLDEESMYLITEAARYARKRWNTTVIVVSHDRDWLDEVCDEVLKIRKGRFVLN